MPNSNNMKPLILRVKLTITSESVCLAVLPNYNDVAHILSGRRVICEISSDMNGDPPRGYRLDSYDQISTVDRACLVPAKVLASTIGTLTGDINQRKSRCEE